MILIGKFPTKTNAYEDGYEEEEEEEEESDNIVKMIDKKIEDYQEYLFLEQNEDLQVELVNREECICYVPEPGIYNGLDLNRYLFPYHPCKLNLYICDKKRLLQKPLLFIDCSKQIGCYYQENLTNCDCSKRQKLWGSNVCGNRISKKNCFKELRYKCHFNQNKAELIGMC